MVAVRYNAIPVVDETTGEALLDARGAVGNIVIEATGVPATLSEDEAGLITISQPLTLTPGGYIPAHWNQDGLEEGMLFVPLSGSWSTPIDSNQGLRNAAVAAVDRAEELLELADVQALLPGTNVTFEPTTDGLVINATGSTGGTADSVSVDNLDGATTLTKSLLKKATSTEWRDTLGITALLATLTTGLAGKQPKARHIDVYYSPTTGWPNPTRTGDEFRRFDSVDHIDAPVPPMVARDRWLAHPESQVYIDRIAGPVTL